MNANNIFVGLEVFWFIKLMIDKHNSNTSEKEMIFSAAMFLFNAVMTARCGCQTRLSIG